VNPHEDLRLKEISTFGSSFPQVNALLTVPGQIGSSVKSAFHLCNQGTENPSCYRR